MSATARRVAPAALSLMVAAALTGCGSTAASTAAVTPTISLPTSDVSVPAGVSVTKPGTTLAFGKAATVGFSPNVKRSTALELTVSRVLRGKISDLSAYTLDPASATATPYYARVSVTNVGDGQIGRSAIPLWGLTSTSTLIGSSGFTTAFARCPSGPLPASFAKGDTINTCLLYLVPKGNTLTGVSFRPLQKQAPIVWKGTIKTTAQVAAAKKAAAKKKAGG